MADPVPTETLSMNYEKIKWSYSKSDAAEDSFDFTGERDGETEMVHIHTWEFHKAAKDAEKKDGDAPADSFDFTGERDEDETAGLLLPAVQQVREGSSLPPDEEDQAVDGFIFGPAKDDTAVEPLDALLIINEINRSAADSDHDKWIDVLSIDWGTHKPAAEAGLRSDGELVQAVSEADMGGDFIL